MKNKIYLIISLFLFSCEKEEIPITLISSQSNITQIDLESNYAKQVFYNLEKNLVTSSNFKTEWDLGFGTEEGVFNIILNSSTFSKLKKIENTIFEEVTTIPDSIGWSWDDPSDYKNTALGSIWNINTTYILDLGFDSDGNTRGFKKFKIDTFTGNYYNISHSNLNNSEINTFQIFKNNEVQHARFSLINNTIINSPKKSDWDLLFSQYTHLFNNPTTPAYLVTGVLINQENEIEVAIDTVNNFNDIIFSNINDYIFNKNQDFIGYDWKTYNHENGYFTINSNINYILKNIEGRYFKLRFIDFYNEMGIKGYPTFEVQEILPV